jgi:hypothetical protein
MELDADDSCTTLRFFAYAATLSGWQEIRRAIRTWMSLTKNRAAIGYVGTDHAITDPDAIRQMQRDKIDIRVMTTYSGIYHPKVFWLAGTRKDLVWVGSNNLTRDGLVQNIEFSTLIRSHQENPDLRNWFEHVHAASEPFSESLLRNYEGERRLFAAQRAAMGTFTWSMKREPQTQVTETTHTRVRNSSPSTTRAKSNTPKSTILPGNKGDLVVEVMPLETGLDGKQMQLPKAAVVRFFGLTNSIGASRRITLNPVGTSEQRTLTMTIFSNNTARLSINELDYRDRPCVIIFHKAAPASFLFEIVRQSIYPGRYRRLLACCINQTRLGSRRWTILQKGDMK